MELLPTNPTNVSVNVICLGSETSSAVLQKIILCCISYPTTCLLAQRARSLVAANLSVRHAKNLWDHCYVAEIAMSC